MKLGSNKIRLVLGCLIGAGFLYLAGRNVDFSLMWEAFTKVNYGLVLIAVPVIFLSHFLRALRWRYLMNPIKRVDVASLLSALLIGYMANILMPAHLGEFVRAWHASKQTGLAASSIFATIVVERLIDVFFLLVLLALALAVFPFPGWVRHSGAAMLALVVLLGALLLLLKRHKQKSMAVCNRLERFLPGKAAARIREMLDQFLCGIAPLRTRGHYVAVGALSLLIWFC